MGVLVAETPKSFSSLVSARAKEAGGVVMMGRFGQDEEADDDDDAAAYRRQAPGHQEQDGPEHRAQHAVPDKDWAPAAPPRPKKKWIRHFLNETPPSHEEFPSTLCTPESPPLVNGRLSAAPSPAETPLPLSPTPSPVLHRPPSPTPSPHLPPHLSPPPLPLPAPSAHPPHLPVVRPVPVVPQGSPPPPPQFSPQPGAPAPAPVSLEAPDSPTNGSQDDDLLGQDSRRRTGSGTREVHNKLEKNRRAHLKECFDMLKRQLPTCQEEKKCSNLSILHAAIRYIQSLRRKERDYEHEMERLAREKISAQQRLASLKKDLAAQWDHLDINALYPDCVDAPNGEMSSRVRLPSPTSTSTASAELEGGMIIDEDDDVDDDDDTMSFHSGRQRSASDSSSAMPAYSNPSGPPPQSLAPSAAPVVAPPNLRDVHGYRGESPQLPQQAPLQARARSPGSPRPRTASPVFPLRPVPRAAPGVLVNGHYSDTSLYKAAGSEGRGVSAPSSGYVPAKLVHHYSIKVASPASAHASPHVSSSSSSSPPAPGAPSRVGVAARVPSSPVGTLTTHHPPAPPRSRASPPHRTSPPAPVSPPASSPGTVLQPLALTSHHIQLPVPAQVVNNGRWLGVSPAILQLAAPPAQRLLDPSILVQHPATSNGTTPLVTHQRIRAAPAGPPHSIGTIGTSAAVSTATAAVTMPAVHSMHANKVLVGATGTVLGEGYHKAGSASPDGIRPTTDVGVLTKGLQLPNEANGHLLATAVHPGSASLPGGHVAHVVSAPSLSPLVTPVTVMSQGSPVTHILAAKNMGKMAPLIKTMPIVNPQYLGAVVKPTMVVVSSASTLPPNSGV